jgi:hypothetical protein
VSEQNPTQKGKPPISITERKIGEGEGETIEIPVVVPICPHCARPLPGLNICEIILPTPQGGMVWMTACCPFMEIKDGLAKDEKPACGKVISSQFVGYRAPAIAQPGAGAWI